MSILLRHALAKVVSRSEGALATAGRAAESTSGALQKMSSELFETLAHKGGGLAKAGSNSLAPKSATAETEGFRLMSSSSKEIAHVNYRRVPTWREPLNELPESMRLAYPHSHPVFKFMEGKHHKFIAQLSYNHPNGVDIGTGFLLGGGQKLVATASHVLRHLPKGDPILVRSLGGQANVVKHRAEVVANIPELDVAILRINGLAHSSKGLVAPNPKYMEGIPLKELPDPRPNQRVFSWGYPGSAVRQTNQAPRIIGNLHVSAGSMKGMGPAAQQFGTDAVPAIIQKMPTLRTDSFLSPGFSGGPTFDTAGKLVGLNSFTVSNWGSMKTAIAPTRSIIEVMRKAGVYKGS